MKNFSAVIGIILCLLFIPHNSYGQTLEFTGDQSKKEMYTFYTSRHKKLKKTGLILLGAGVAATITGYTILYNQSWNDDWTPGLLLFMGGAITTTASIPVLIIAGSNKRKAEALVLMGRHQMMDMTLTSSRYISVGLKVELF